MDYKAHWSHIYQSRGLTDVSWYQARPDISLGLIQGTGVGKSARIIDVGAGGSTLVDHLLGSGFQSITLLDLSDEALQAVRERLGAAAAPVTFIAGDVTTVDLPQQAYDVWHDRAVFHFLTDTSLKQRYVEQVRRSVVVGGHVIVGTFALDGPDQCSGLTVARYDAASLHGAFGGDFRLIASCPERHVTPWGSEQQFIYCYCRMEPETCSGARRNRSS